MGLFLFSCLALLATWFFWAKHESLNTKLKNLARKNEDGSRKSSNVVSTINTYDTYMKLTAPISHFILIGVIGFFVMEYVTPGNVATLVGYVLYGLASRLFFFELIYNLSIGKDIFYIGTGPSKMDKFFREILKNPNIYFYLKLSVFLLSILGLYLTVTNIVVF